MPKFNDDFLVTPLVRQRLMDESEDSAGILTGFWAVLTKTNGEQQILRAGTSIQPEPTQQMFAYDMGADLNKEIRHNGAWIVFWTHPMAPSIIGLTHADFRLWHFLWLDQDGDPQFTVDNEDPFWWILAQGADHWLEQAEYAWEQWKLMMRDVLAPTPEQTFKRAQGQAPNSTKGYRA